MRGTSTYWARVLALPVIALAAVGMLALVGAGPASANGDGAGIVGSPHDFSNETWNHRDEICRVCHVPHDHNRSTLYWEAGLLWNHALSELTYTMYSSTSLDGAQDTQPTGISKLCLGCHDGTVAIDQFDNVGTGTTFIGSFDDGFKVPGGAATPSLQGTHPISIVYSPGTGPNQDAELRPVTDPMGTSGTIDDVLDGGKVQCSSCHDVHDSAGEAVPDTHLLRVAQTTAKGGATPSALCLTCHIK